MVWSNRLPDHSVSGDADVTVFLLHGVYGAKEYWRFVTRHLLDAGYRVVAWDAPGYGLSPPDDDFTLMNAARACARLIGRTGTARNIVFGQSMGGQIAMRTYQMVPALIDGVIIASTIGYLGNKTPEEQAEFMRSRQSAEKEAGAVSRKNADMVTSMMAAGVSGVDVDLVRTIGADTPGRAVQASIQAIRNAPDQEAIAALRGIAVPALFIAGEVDQTGRPEGMKRIAAMVPGSRFEVVAGCGHYVWAENPAAFWEKVDPFLASVARPRRAAA